MTEDKKTELLKLAKQNFELWNNALQTKKAATVADLYDSEATFLPTLNGELKRGKLGAEGYFEHFLLKHPFGRLVEDEVQAIELDGSLKAYLHSGLYDFEVGEPDNRQTVAARFTFLWQKNNEGEWKIAHHHSSLKPE